MVEEIVLNSRQEAFKKAVLGRAGFFNRLQQKFFMSQLFKTNYTFMFAAVYFSFNSS